MDNYFQPIVERIVEVVQNEGDPYPCEVVKEEKTYIPLREMAENNTYQNIKKMYQKERPHSYRDLSFTDKGGDY